MAPITVAAVHAAPVFLDLDATIDKVCDYSRREILRLEVDATPKNAVTRAGAPSLVPQPLPETESLLG